MGENPNPSTTAPKQQGGMGKRVYQVWKGSNVSLFVFLCGVYVSCLGHVAYCCDFFHRWNDLLCEFQKCESFESGSVILETVDRDYLGV